jgi:hypothetical protein
VRLANAVDLSFFVAGVEVTEVGFEEVIAVEGGKRLTLGAGASGKDRCDGRRQVVVTDAVWDAVEEGEGRDMAGEKGLLPLGKKRPSPAHLAHHHR